MMCNYYLLVHLLAVFIGVQLSEFQTKSAVRTCGLSFSGNLIMYTTDKAMSQPCEMRVYDSRDDGQMSKLAYLGRVLFSYFLLVVNFYCAYLVMYLC